MSKKIYIQFFLIFTFVVISLLIFFKYFKKTITKNDLKVNMEKTANTGKSLIEDLKYLSTDKEGNEYKIEAIKGKIDKDNPDIIYMENVVAVILLQNSETIFIKSKFAKYNTKNFDTLFNNSVSLDYGEHNLKSEFLDLSFENNLVSVYDNVRYLSGISSLKADRAEIDILNKNTKIFMENSNKKVQINNLLKNGNN
tara:strand:- start:4263 stop:4853 length:591 start_codon:yes stop_codon:yes gene_type:complete